MRILFIIFILNTPFLSQADIYKNMKCRSDLSVALKGQKSRKSFKAGTFSVSDNESQIIYLKSKKNKTLLKIYPWYGVDIKASAQINILNKNTYLNNEFSISFLDKSDAKKVYSISCQKY